MSDNVGSMEVEYTVTVNSAIKNIEKYNKMTQKADNVVEKHGKKETMLAKKSGLASKVIAGGMAVAASAITIGLAAIVGGLLLVTAGLYGIIRASSYASIYTSQFGAIVQQIANQIMESSGLNTVIEDLLRSFQNFADNVKDVGWVDAILIALGELDTWLSTNFISGFDKAWEGLENLWDKLSKSGLWDKLKNGFSRAIEFIRVEIYPRLLSFWDTKLKPAIIWGITKAWEFIKTLLPQWVIDIIVWAKNLGAAIYTQDWEGVWDSVVEPFEWAWDKFTKTKLGGLIEDIINKILEYEDKITDMIKNMAWYEVGVAIVTDIWRGIKSNNFVYRLLTGNGKTTFQTSTTFGGGLSGGKGFGDSWSGTNISASSMPGGGDYNDVVIAPGGNVITTHPKDFLIATKKPEELTGGNVGSTYNISPIININSGIGNGLTNDMSRQISKAIAEEIKRIVKV